MNQKLDKRRDQEPDRKEMHNRLDAKRDKTTKRKAMHQDIDKKRDKTHKRRKMHQENDRIRDRYPERIYYKKSKITKKYQENLINKLYTDTGFDVICSCCLQYKSLEYCKPISTLDRRQQQKYIVKYCALLKNRSNLQHICNICLKDIKKDKIPF